jgi:hypothetical protein
MRYGNATRPSTTVRSWLNGPLGTGASGTPAGYQRPIDWLELPTVTAGQQTIVGLCAVYQDEPNYIAFTIAGSYTVNWGDGSSVQNISSGVRAEHLLSWSGCPASTLTSEGFRQAIVTVTMQSSNNLTTARFDRPHTSSGSAMTQQPWLDIRMSAPNCTRFGLGDEWVSDSSRLQRFEWVGTNQVTDMWWAFARCRSLRQVVALDTSNVTNTTEMFLLCGALMSLPALDLSACEQADRMFAECLALAYLPAFTMNTSVAYYTDSYDYARGWFAADNGNYAALRRIPALDMSKQLGTLLNNEDYYLSLSSIGPLTGLRTALNLYTMSISATELNAVYTALATLSTATKSVTGAVSTSDGPFDWITYTTGTAHGYVAGQAVTITGASPSGYNVTRAVIVDVGDATHFKCLVSSFVGTPWSSGGTVAQATFIDVTGNPGASSDTPSIATGKGWTVIG